MDREELTFEGFVFANKDDLELAKAEKKKVDYITSHTDMNNQSLIRGIYEKAIETKTFQTPIGLNFLSALRTKMLAGIYKEEEITPIPLYTTFRRIDFKEPTRIKQRLTAAQKKELTLKQRYRNMTFIAGILLVLVVLMLAITLSGPNMNALNYRKAVTNEFASWEQELTDRENAIREKEKELGIVNY